MALSAVEHIYIYIFSKGSPLYLWPMASWAKAPKRTSHKVSLEQTGETWNYVPIYTIFGSPEIEIEIESVGYQHQHYIKMFQ